MNKRVFIANNLKETGKIKILQTTDIVSTIGRGFYDVKVRERAEPAGTAEFHVFNMVCALTLNHQHQIIKAWVRVRGVSD